MSVRNVIECHFKRVIVLVSILYYSIEIFSAPRDHRVNRQDGVKCITSLSKLANMTRALSRLETAQPNTPILLRTINGEVYSGNFIDYYQPKLNGIPDRSKSMVIKISGANGRTHNIPISAIYAQEGQLVIDNPNAVLPVPHEMSATRQQSAMAKMTTVEGAANEYYVDLKDIVPSQDSVDFHFTERQHTIQSSGESLVREMDASLDNSGAPQTSSEELRQASTQAIEATFNNKPLEVMIIDGQIVSFSNRRPKTYYEFLRAHHPQVRVKLLSGPEALHEFSKGKLSTNGESLHSVRVRNGSVSAVKSRYTVSQKHSPEVEFGALLKSKANKVSVQSKAGNIKQPIIESGRKNLIKIYQASDEISLEKSTRQITDVFDSKVDKLQNANTVELKAQFKNQVLDLEDSLFVDKYQALVSSSSVSLADFQKLADDLTFLRTAHPEKASRIAGDISEQLLEISDTNTVFEQAFELFDF